MSAAERERLLAHAARRAAQRPSFLARDLAAYQELHGLSDEALASALGCDLLALWRLALCRRPDPDAPTFAADVERIAAHVGVRATRLVRLLREVDVLATLRQAPELQAEQGFLLAARDREEPEPGDGPGGDPTR